MEYNVHISKLVSIFFLTVFGYIAFEKQIQQHFSKCESNLRERERERREGGREGGRDGRTDGRTDGGGREGGREGGRDGRTEGRTDGRTDGQTDRQTDRERERERGREGAWREFDVPPSLTNNCFLETVLCYNLLLKRQLTATFVLAWHIALNSDCQKLSNYVIFLWSMRKK